MFDQFYEKYPNFDWKFYVILNKDLQGVYIKTEEQAIMHYLKFGIKENRRTHVEIKNEEKIFKTNFDFFMNISSQCYFSNGVLTFKKRIKDKYKLVDYYDTNKPCLFFGMYNNEDLRKIKNHKSLRIIVWCGEDTNKSSQISIQTIKEIKLLKNVIHLTKSKSTYENLRHHNIYNILTNYNVVDTSLFKPVLSYNLGNKILIFNGQSKGREHIYNEKIYSKIIQLLPQFQYIFSNQLNVKWEQMPKIYKECFIMLRLTDNDGNANSVQECEAIGIPAIHNQSCYGLKWKNFEDVKQHILHQYKKKRISKFTLNKRIK